MSKIDYQIDGFMSYCKSKGLSEKSIRNTNKR